MVGVKLVGFLVAALSVTFTYAPSWAVSRDDVDMRGTITRIRRASAEEESRFVGTILVERDEKAGEGVDQANLIITAETRIFLRRGGERRRAAFEDLRVGEARFVDGPTIMMYPLQVGASEIVVLNRGRAKE
jgi:hypothetical protein